MVNRYRPLLAPAFDPSKNTDYFKTLKYPYLVSVKLDGIRCITRTVPILSINENFEECITSLSKDVCLSRELKPLPSSQVQAHFSAFTGLDGEVIVGEETDVGVYNRTQSHVMSAEKPHSDLRYRVFDTCDADLADQPFEERLDYARGLITAYSNAFKTKANVSLVEHTLCRSYDELIAEEERALSQGYEGLMLRNPDARYKHNRATVKENIIYKLKRFQDDEAVVIGFEEGTKNTNEKTTDEKGYAQRSSKKEGLVLSDTLGKFIVSYKGTELLVAPGAFTHAQRKAIFDNQEKYLGLLLKFRFFAYGMKNLPRFPRAIGFRDRMDFQCATLSSPVIATSLL